MTDDENELLGASRVARGQPHPATVTKLPCSPAPMGTENSEHLSNKLSTLLSTEEVTQGLFPLDR